ncbi:hypothetical protein [Fluviicola sp.]|uniref:hypothetical protein n=1 Tax=Fluviicola sp. TaxID=1917219 RepID=UPI0031E45E16
MKNQIAWKGGVASLAISLIFLSACKKEEITTKQSNSEPKEQAALTYSSVAKIYGERPEEGFLNLTVSSNDEAYLKEYVAKLEQTNIAFQEADPSQDAKPNPVAESDSKSGVAFHFDWSNYHFNLQKGKIYALAFAKKSDSKALVLFNSMANCINFSVSSGSFAAVNLYSTFKTGATWYLNSASTGFYHRTLVYHDNLEVRTFTAPTSPGTNGFGSFVYNSTTVYYRPRINYSSPEMPTPYTDYGSITSGTGYATLTPDNIATANATFYVAG